MENLPKNLRVGIILFPLAFPLDWVGPLDILNGLRSTNPWSQQYGLNITTASLADTMESVEMHGGWTINPQMTFQDAANERWDILFVPGGIGARPFMESNRTAREYVLRKANEVKVIMTGESRYDPLAVSSVVVTSHEDMRRTQDGSCRFD